MCSFGLKQSQFLIEYGFCTQRESDERTPGCHKWDEFRLELPLASKSVVEVVVPTACISTGPWHKGLYHSVSLLCRIQRNLSHLSQLGLVDLAGSPPLRSGANKSIGIGKNVVVLCSLEISFIVCK
jgi:hypothetical protein